MYALLHALVKIRRFGKANKTLEQIGQAIHSAASPAPIGRPGRLRSET